MKSDPGRILPAGFLPPLRHMLLHLLTFTILLDSAWFSLENRPMIDFQEGTKQDQAEKHHTRSFPYLNSTHDRFALDDQAENQYKRHYNIATFNIPVLKIAIFCRIAPL